MAGSIIDILLGTPYWGGSREDQPDRTWLPRQPLVEGQDAIQAPRRRNATRDKIPNLLGRNKGRSFQTPEEQQRMLIRMLLSGMGVGI